MRYPLRRNRSGEIKQIYLPHLVDWEAIDKDKTLQISIKKPLEIMSSWDHPERYLAHSMPKMISVDQIIR